MNITFENYLNTVNTLMNYHTPLKKTQQKESFNKKHRFQKDLKFIFLSFFKMGFTPFKAEQPLHGLELQGKEA